MALGKAPLYTFVVQVSLVTGPSSQYDSFLSKMDLKGDSSVMLGKTAHSFKAS